MVQYRLNIETESRIRWKVYVRFGGEHLEIAHVHMIRRRVLSLHFCAVSLWFMGCKSMTQESAVPSPTVFTIVLGIVRMKNFTVNIYRNYENNIS